MNTTVCRIPVSASIVARPQAARPFKPAVTALKRNIVIVRAEPAPDAVETAIKGAEETCKDGSQGECAAAWDEVRVYRLWACRSLETASTCFRVEEFVRDIEWVLDCVGYCVQDRGVDCRVQQQGACTREGRRRTFCV